MSKKELVDWLMEEKSWDEMNIYLKVATAMFIGLGLVMVVVLGFCLGVWYVEAQIEAFYSLQIAISGCAFFLIIALGFLIYGEIKDKDKRINIFYKISLSMLFAFMIYLIFVPVIDSFIPINWETVQRDARIGNAIYRYGLLSFGAATIVSFIAGVIKSQRKRRKE